jgi:preprotein translocase subunit SecE
VAKEAVEKKAEKQTGQNRFIRYLRETYYELKRVSWPTRSEAVNLTIIVVAVTTFMSVILGLMDRVFSWGFGLFL